MAHELGREVLLEIHGEKELDYVELEPDMCGVNNRNLGTFGISNPETVRQLRMAGFNGFLIGENFMKTADPGAALKSFLADCTMKNFESSIVSSL